MAENQTTDAERLAEKQAPATAPRTKSAREAEIAASAANQRADYVRALNEEREMCERSGKADRVKAIGAELARFDDKPAGRRKPASDQG